MAEAEATIPENSEPQDAPVEQPVPSADAPIEDAPPKRGRGRPAGAKDKAPRATKPKVRAEPIPQAEAKAKPKARPAQAAPQPAPQAHPVEPTRPPVADEAACCRTPEPPSPRTLFRETSAHLLNLRDVMNSQKRASAAERYTNRLHAWPVM